VYRAKQFIVESVTVLEHLLGLETNPNDSMKLYLSCGEASPRVPREFYFNGVNLDDIG